MLIRKASFIFALCWYVFVFLMPAWQAVVFLECGAWVEVVRLLPDGRAVWWCLVSADPFEISVLLLFLLFQPQVC